MTYSNTGKPLTVTDPRNNTTTNTYDAAERLQTVTDPLGRQLVYAYDHMGRAVSLTNPGIQSEPLEAYAYTPDGLRASFTDANGNATSFAYDGFDRLQTTTWPDTSTETLTYDANDNVLTRTTRASDTITYTYDTLDRLATKARPSEPTVTYGYDLAGRMIRVSDDSAAIQAVTGSPASFLTELSYDALDRPLGVSWSPAPAQTDVTPASVLFTHTYDASNRRAAQSTTDDAWWSLPTTGQITDYVANNLNQYTSIEPILPSGSTVTPSYDSNGNLSDDDTLTYAYDSENRLSEIADGGGTVATYTYDGRGRRKSKTVGSSITVFVTDAEDREVLEYDGSTGAPIAWYAFGLGPDTVLNRMDHSGSTRSTFIPDIQGSIVGELDATTASLTTGGYQPYGSNTADTSAGFRYTARRLDPETAGGTSQPSGLYYYRARMYSPAWGRFLQPDPIGYEGGRNLYAYVGNDPLNAVDPSGEIAETVGELLIPSAAAADQGISSQLKGTTSLTPPSELPIYPHNQMGPIIDGNQGGGIARIPPPKPSIALGSGNQSPARNLGVLLNAGRAMDRGNLTKAGRALAKHGGREGSVFPQPSGNPNSINRQGQAVLVDILSNVVKTSPNRFGGSDYFGGSRGGGARFDVEGNFMGFLEP